MEESKENSIIMKAHMTLSKKKFSLLLEDLKRKFDEDTIDQIKESFRTALQFDVNANTYNAQRSEEIKRYLQKKKEQGISTYVALGQKKAYERKKALKGT